MSASSKPGQEPDTMSMDTLEQAASRLAKSHQAARRLRRGSFRPYLAKIAAGIKQVYEQLSTLETELLSSATERLLDNYYVVQRALRELRQDMPEGYFRKLPKLATEMPFTLRVYALASKIISLGEGRFDAHLLTRFLSAYQQLCPLSMGELWALPAMLRLVVLEQLLQAATQLEELAEQLEPRQRISSNFEEWSVNQLISSSVISLHQLNKQDWKSFFEQASQVESILRLDPAGVYKNMDFETRDRYRDIIEQLAEASKKSETELAQELVALATTSEKLPARKRHIGYYLIDRGRRQLEQRLAYRPPIFKRIRRWLFDHPTWLYLGSISILSLLLLFSLLWYLATAGVNLGPLLAAGLLAVIPAIIIATAVLDWFFTEITSPRVLPKLNFDKGLPDNCKTVIAVPAILSSKVDLDALLQQLELHYVGNADPNLYVALLSDFPDAEKQQLPTENELLKQAQDGIKRLNEKYRSADNKPFMLFHRDRRWNPRERCWMAWERKRGKLHEFNQLILFADTGSFIVQVADLKLLQRVKYVITLDADSLLPPGTARRLVATLAHPLNQAEFASESNTVVAGYTLLQPRVEINPSSANQTLFSRIFSRNSGLDPYSRAVSDIYQDLFAVGIYAGKGIYDVAAFERSLHGRVPENTLLSHDLFEGIHGRAALVTDIPLMEDFPPHYLAYTRRLHRWIRGDWQLLPWLGLRVPHSQGMVPNTLTVIDRWKILNNLLRSLLMPSLLALMVLGWVILPVSPFFWALFGLLVLAIPLVSRLLTELLRSVHRASVSGILNTVLGDLLRWLLAVVFLPFESFLALDAIGHTLYRLAISRKNLLQWVTTAHAERTLAVKDSATFIWRSMLIVPLFVLTLTVLLTWLKPASLFAAGLLILAWFASPQLAFAISRPSKRQKPSLSAKHRQRLQSLARRTWLYFERFVGPEDHWLPPDHYQEDPRGVLAHRSSPTNLGLLLCASLTAYDLGYLGMQELALRLRDSFNTMARLERYRGHFLNWYDTRTLKPLAPRYVSTVDSGNLLACLLTLKQGCLELDNETLWRWQRWQGLLDTLAVLSDIVDNSGLKFESVRLTEQLKNMYELVLASKHKPESWSPLLEKLNKEIRPEMDRLLLAFISEASTQLDTSTLSAIGVWSGRVHAHLDSLKRECDGLLPWLAVLDKAPKLFSASDTDPAVLLAWQELQKALPTQAQLKNHFQLCQHIRAQLALLQERLDNSTAGTLRDEAQAWCQQLSTSISVAEADAADLRLQLQALAHDAEAYVTETDMSFLFDPLRKVFSIGYNLDANKLDDNSYDLLASEARIASLIAIAMHQVPPSHWLHLARPLTRLNGTRLLLSWSGTMFEYLMPTLFMRTPRDSLLEQSCQAAVNQQISYGHSHSTPWGISESSYYQFDANMNYQYRAFGVPGLGFQRGLADHLVIAPYASLLALPFAPQAVWRNLMRLQKIDMMGQYGLYEAVDYTTSRLPLGKKHAIVRSYMAHHQGMVLLSLGNMLNRDKMIARFHANPQIKSVELLLYEQIPAHAPIDYPETFKVGKKAAPAPPPVLEPWPLPASSPQPQIHYLSNGRYGLLISNAGSGYSHWQKTALSRWRADSTLENWGSWLYVQDLESGDLWSATRQPSGKQAEHEEIYFSPDKVKFQRLDNGLGLGLEITVSPNDDVELRRVTLINHRAKPRLLALTSYSEVVLSEASADERHPVFGKLFVESEYLPDIGALIFRRRPRSAEEKTCYLAHMLVAEGDTALPDAFESNRGRFLGRGASLRQPVALSGNGPGLSNTTGATLDPVMSLQKQIHLPAHSGMRLAFLTIVAGSRQELLKLLHRYQVWPMIEQAFDQAHAHSEHELHQLGLDSSDLVTYQKLLSALYYPQKNLRAEAAVLKANRHSQAGLWAYGISGDYPLLVMQVKQAADSSLVLELLKAHRYWRKRGLLIDFLILNEQETGYSLELHGKLHRLITQTGGDIYLGQRGGIFLLRADQLPEDKLILLKTVARAILSTDRGSLAVQVRRLLQTEAQLPAFKPKPPDYRYGLPTPALKRPEKLLFDNGLGGFSADGREYIIYLKPEQWTPAPWINVIANPRFGFLVSEAGSGYSWAGNSGENRLTPWRNDPVSDQTSEALYLRDEETAEYWSPTPLPARANAPYLVRHGAGYSVFEHHSHGLKQHLRLFAIKNAPVKVVQLRLKNCWQYPRRLTVTYYAEWVLGNTRESHQLFVVPSYAPQQHALLAQNRYQAEFTEQCAFLASSRAPYGLSTDRTEFLGRLGSFSRPAALGRIGLSGTVEAGRDPCAAIQVHIDLPPGGSEELFFLLGCGSNKAEALDLIQDYAQTERLARAWRELGEHWDKLLGTITLQTPEPALNLMLGRWLLYQSISSRLWGRSALYQSSGAYGFRDQLQDSMAVLYTTPELSREQILRAARHQFEEGDVLHWWHPPSGRGVRTRISDDLVWLPYVTAHYVTVTKDLGILNEQLPFLQGPQLNPDELEHYGQFETTTETHSLYEHCLRALNRALNTGPHGLPLMGGGDWNDGMNRVGSKGQGESVWLAWFLYATLTNFAPLCAAMNDSKNASHYRQKAEALSQAIEEHAWDGEWYLRAFYDDGTPLGTAGAQECQIDAVAQSWAVLSGAAPLKRARQAMEAVYRRLIREEDRLILLLTPPFDKTIHDPGYIKGYLPGIRENGGQYTHGALWTIWAFTTLGDGDRAEALFRLLNPVYHSDSADKIRRYKVEPYVVAADVYGLPPHTGRGGWTWYTGSAAWMYRLGLEAILGLNKTGATLEFNPCIPRSWPYFDISYRYGHTLYQIHIDNPAGVNRGIKRLILDGEVLTANKIPLHKDGKEHMVLVVMG